MNIKAIKSAAVYSNDCTCIFSGILKDWYQTLSEAAVYRQVLVALFLKVVAPFK